MKNINIGDSVLVSTDNWFIAPDGKQYRAAFGVLKGIFTDSDMLGIKTNARSTNWYLQVGNLVIAGCQIHYALKTETYWSDANIIDDKKVDCIIYNAGTGE